MRKFSEKLYRTLLGLYPKAYRREYADPMMQAFRDLYNAAYGKHGKAGVVLLWLHLFADAVISASIEHREVWKERIMGKQKIPVKAQAVVVFLPIIGMVAYLYIAGSYNDIALIYILMLITGVGAWVLNRLGFVPRIPLWNTYTVGVFLGIGMMILTILGGLPAFGVHRFDLPPILILIISLTIWAGATHLMTHVSSIPTRTLWSVSALLLCTTMLAYLVSEAHRGTDDTALYLGITYSLMQMMGALGAAVVSVRLMQSRGKIGLIALMVAIGVQFVWLDPAYFTGSAGQWINLGVLFFPLVICPVWWLRAPTQRTRRQGTFAIWAVFIALMAITPSMARWVMYQQYPGYYEDPGAWIARILMTLPYLAAMWLALFGTTAHTPDTDVSIPSEAIPQAS